MYEKYFKRLLDLICSVCALIVLSPMFLILIIVGGAIIMRKAILFSRSPRPER